MADVPRTDVLVLRALALGDLFVAVPALRALRRACAGKRIVLAAPAWAADLFVGDAVDAIWPVSGLDEDLRQPGGAPRVVVNLHGKGPQSHRVLDALGPRVRLGFHDPPSWPGPDYAATLAAHPNERDLWCAMLEAQGLAVDAADLRLAPPDPVSSTVVIHPGAAFGAKQWPAERFAEVARALERVGPVVVTGTEGERAVAERVADCAGLGPERVLAGRTSLPQLCALVASALLVVCGDTGIAHVASAYGTPSVVLFGPVGPDRWGPPPGPHVALDRPTVRTGNRFAAAPDAALLAITPAEVLEAVRGVIRQ